MSPSHKPLRPPAPARRKRARSSKPRSRAPVVYDDSNREVRKLLHELQVHSEEITVQNEQLIASQAELERSRDRLSDLYDFAPVGYVSIDSRAAIVDINLAGADMLGRPRGFMIKLPLSSLIAAEDSPVLRDFLIQSRDKQDDDEVSADVRVRRIPDRIIRLVARPTKYRPAPGHLLAAIVDVTQERHFETERTAALLREQARARELSKEVAERKLAEARVKALLERLVTVQEEERRRIARNLHDHLGQQVTALRLTIGSLRERLASPQEAKRQAELADSIAASIDRDVDMLAWELRPAALDEAGLEAALNSFVREWSATHHVRTELHVLPADAARLTSDIESQVYRIVQEALNNVGKHASAKRASIMLRRTDASLDVTIEDDGRGFDAAHQRRRGMGLTSITERAALIGGSVQFESAVGKGTTVFVRIPLRTSHAKTK